MTILSRRQFLRRSTSLSLGAGMLTTFGSALPRFGARAANVSGYKALVCLNFLGGLDCHDVVLPYDQASYDQFASVRQPLLDLYAGNAGGSTRARDRLLPLTPYTSGEFGGRQFALPEELSGLHSLFEQGDAAIVGNVGPLVEASTRSQIDNGEVRTPKRLFSHNDQSSTWVSSEPEGASFGWGGRFADAVQASGANLVRDFTTMTTLGNELFLTGEMTLPYQVGLNGAPDLDALRVFGYNRWNDAGEQAYQELRQHFLAQHYASSHLMERDMATGISAALQLNEQYDAARETLPELGTPFPDSHLGRQLRAIAEAIAIRGSFGASRQVFYAADGGFDTHSDQQSSMPQLQSNINDCVVAFQNAMVELGVSQDVTLFTASEFGRTLAVNGDGTDHGWGAHHFIVGGAVQGGRIYGDIPPPELDHDFDTGGGRLIPTTSVEQYAGALGRWFGLSDSELDVALPNLRNFGGLTTPAFA